MTAQATNANTERYCAACRATTVHTWNGAEWSCLTHAPTVLVDETSWFERASDLLAEPDPGPTPFLVDKLIVEASIVAVVGAPKASKTWTMLDLAIAVATGELALSRFNIANPGPVLLILEESGRAALHRRLDMLARGRALEADRLVEFCFAANRRVRLNDLEWQKRLLDAAGSREWRLIGFDPLARIKGAAVDENVQREIGPVLDFLRDLRDVRGTTVGYVHHTPHDGARQRGSSDLEAYWESKLTLVKTNGTLTLKAEHREAEAAGPYTVSSGFDANTRTVRMRAVEDELGERVGEYLERNPDASANEVFEEVGGKRERVLDLVKQLRQAGTQAQVPVGTTTPGSDVVGGTHPGPYKGPGTTTADDDAEAVPEGGYHLLPANDDELVVRAARSTTAGVSPEQLRKLSGLDGDRLIAAVDRAEASGALVRFPVSGRNGLELRYRACVADGVDEAEFDRLSDKGHGWGLA